MDLVPGMAGPRNVLVSLPGPLKVFMAGASPVCLSALALPSCWALSLGPMPG